MIVQQKYNLACQYLCHFGSVFVRAYRNIIGACTLWRSKFVPVYTSMYTCTVGLPLPYIILPIMPIWYNVTRFIKCHYILVR